MSRFARPRPRVTARSIGARGILAFLLIIVFASDTISPFGTLEPVSAESSMTGPGTYRVSATKEGLVGGMTSSGHIIVPNDYFVSLPACTSTNCPGGPYWGQMTNCGSVCYVKVTNLASGACRVEKVLDTGPWFRVDDWWNTTADRYLNKLPSNPQDLPQGYAGADAARDGLNVGYGKGSGGIGSSDVYATVGSRSAIDLADGTWDGIGLGAGGYVSQLGVELLWQSGADPSASATGCGHPLNENPGGGGTLQVSPQSGIVGSSITVSGSGYTSGETVRIYWNTTASTPLASVTATGGSFSTTITVPETPRGSYQVIAAGASSGKQESTPFSVAPSLSRTPTSGPAGTQVSVTARGFGANEQVRLNWISATGMVLGSATTNALGTGSTTITIPASTVGSYDYVGTGLTSGARAYGAIYVTAGGPTPSPTGTVGTQTPTATATVTSTPTITPTRTPTSPAGTGTAVVTGTGGGGVNCRTAPSTSSQVITVLPEGATVTLNGAASNGWQPVLCGGRAGYVFAQYLSSYTTPTPTATPTRTPSPTATKSPTATATATRTLTPTATTPPSATPTRTPAPTATRTPTTAPPTATPTAGQARVTGTGGAGVNCRSTPSTSGAVITVLAEGATVTLNGTASNGWQPVICRGRAGYVSAQYLTVTTPPSTPVPTATATPTRTPTTTPTRTPTATVTRTPSPTATVTLPATATPTRTPTIAATTAPATAKVTGTGGVGVNCRSTPSTSGSVITVLPEGATVQLNGTASNGWQPVICGGRAGFVSAQYLSINGASAAAAMASNETMTPTATTTVTESATTTPTGPAASPVNTETATPTPTATEPVAEDTPPVGEPTATATVTIEPTAEPTLEPTIEPTATSEPTPQPPTATTEVIFDPIPGWIAGTGGDGALLRQTADPNGSILATLPEGNELTITGPAIGDWTPVVAQGVEGFVASVYVTTTQPAPTPEPTVAPSPSEEVVATETPGDAVIANDIPITEEPIATEPPQTVIREVSVPVVGDASVSQAQPDVPNSGELGGVLMAGGPDGAETVLTFAVEGVGAGTVINAQLVITGSGGGTAGSGGNLLVGYVGFDEYGVTANQVASSGLGGAGWVDSIAPGIQTVVDVTGIVTADGTISFVIAGTPDIAVGIGSRENGAPAYLVLTIEEAAS